MIIVGPFQMKLLYSMMVVTVLYMLCLLVAATFWEGLVGLWWLASLALPLCSLHRHREHGWTQAWAGPHWEVWQPWFMKCLCRIYQLGFLKVFFLDFCADTVIWWFSSGPCGI